MWEDISPLAFPYKVVLKTRPFQSAFFAAIRRPYLARSKKKSLLLPPLPLPSWQRNLKRKGEEEGGEPHFKDLQKSIGGGGESHCSQRGGRGGGERMNDQGFLLLLLLLHLSLFPSEGGRGGRAESLERGMRGIRQG